MKYLSLCSGIEAASQAWIPLGWEPVAFSEIEPFPCAVLAHHYPETPNLGDMTKYHEWPDTLRFDILAGGTPCQGFSLAGLRKGLDDARSQLSLVFVEIAARYRPRWLVWENVPGVLSSEGGADFATLLAAFTGREISTPETGWKNSGHVDGIKEAYGVAWRVLDAQHCGIPQRRRRVFLVGYLGDWRRAAAVLFEPESLRGDSPPSRETGKGIAHVIAPCIGASGRGFERTGDTRGQDCVIAVAPTLDASFARLQGCSGQDLKHGHGHLIPFNLRGRDGGAMPEVDPDGLVSQRAASGGSSRSYIAFDTTQITSPENRSNPHPGDPCHPLAATAHPPAVAFSGRARGDDGRGYDREPLITGDQTGTLDTVKPWNVATGSCVRRVTPLECERLQGFPDNFTAIPWRRKPVDQCPDGPRYKALGNSWAVPCARWIGERIQMVERMVA